MNFKTTGIMDYIKNINLVLSDPKNKLTEASLYRLNKIKINLISRVEPLYKMLERRNMLMARGEAIKKRACTFTHQKYLPLESKEQKKPLYEEVNEKGYFLRFGEEAEGLQTGFGNFTVAIVEGEDGQVYTINPNNLRFIK